MTQAEARARVNSARVSTHALAFAFRTSRVGHLELAGLHSLRPPARSQGHVVLQLSALGRRPILQPDALTPNKQPVSCLFRGALLIEVYPRV